MTSIIRREHFGPEARDWSTEKRAKEALDYEKLTEVQQRLIHVNILRRNRIEYTTKSRASGRKTGAAEDAVTPQTFREPREKGFQRSEASATIAVKSSSFLPRNVVSRTAAPPTIAHTSTEIGSRLNIQRHLSATPSKITELSRIGASQPYPQSPKLKPGGALVCPYCEDLLPRSYAKHESSWRWVYSHFQRLPSLTQRQEPMLPKTFSRILASSTVVRPLMKPISLPRTFSPI